MKKVNAGLMGLVLVAALTWFSGCATMDKAYEQQVTWTNTPVVKTSTTTVVLTNIVPQVVERTKVVMVTNEATGAVSGYTAREPITGAFGVGGAACCRPRRRSCNQVASQALRVQFASRFRIARLRYGFAHDRFSRLRRHDLRRGDVANNNARCGLHFDQWSPLAPNDGKQGVHIRSR